MTWFDRLRLARVLAVLALASSPARAESFDCSAIQVEADASVHSTWPELPQHVRDAFIRRDGIEPCARIRLTRHQTAIGVRVTLPDGRVASRSVPERDDVVPVLEALLLVPASDAAARSAEASEPAESVTAAPKPEAPRRRKRVEPAKFRIAERDVASTEEPRRARGLGLELSAFGSVRAGDGQFSAGGGLLSFVDVFGWLVGFQGRIDGYPSSGAPPGGTLELALLAGRRLRHENTALDLFAGPALMIQAETESVESGPAGPYRETSSGALGRLVFGSHLHFATDSVLRSFVGIDGEVGQGNQSGEAPNGPHDVPRWMLGIALGATLGTR